MTQHEKLLSYMIGWRKGAGGGVFTDAQMAEAYFKAGWDDGRIASGKAYAAACAVLGTELSPLKTEAEKGTT